MSLTLEQSAGLLEHFKELKDPRAEHLLEYYLLDIIGLTICAVICCLILVVSIDDKLLLVMIRKTYPTRNKGVM